MNYLEYIIGGTIAAVFSGISWLVRRVLTNEKQIALLQTEIISRDERRNEDREIMRDIQSDLKEVKRDILDLYKKNDLE
jgi:hypothetical protein